MEPINKSVIAAAGITAVTGCVLILLGVQIRISLGIGLLAGITAGVATRRNEENLLGRNIAQDLSGSIKPESTEDDLREELYKSSLVHFSSSRYQECINDINEFFSLPSKVALNHQARLLSTRAACRYALNEDLHLAILDAQRAVSIEKSSLTLNDLGNIQQELGLINEAINSFSEAITLSPEDAFILSNRGIAKTIKGDLRGALSDFTLAIERGHLRAFFYRGNLRCNKLDDYEGAIDDFTAAINSDACADNHYYYYNRAFARYSQNDLSGALEDCDLALVGVPEYIRPIRLKAKIHFQLGRLGQAKECYLRIIEKNSEDFYDYDELGTIENQLENDDIAIRHLTHSIRMNLGDSESPVNKDAFTNSSYFLAHSLYRQGYYQDAVTVALECEKHCELNAEFLRVLACAYDCNAESEKALEVIDKALSLDDSSAIIWYDRGVIRRDQGNRDGAIADFKKAFSLDHTLGSACHNIGSIYHDSGDMTQACQYWKIASDLGDKESAEFVAEYCNEG